MAETLNKLGLRRAMVVHSSGLDEISTMGKTNIMHLEDGRIWSEELDPTDYGFRLADFSDLSGGDAQLCAGIVRDVLYGRETGPRREIVLLNAAAAIVVAGLAKDFVEGIEKADAAINSGAAANCLETLIKISNHQEEN
jgi:anthranilate phosphoribosyltransferase